MPPQITTALGQANFEIVRDRIASILTEEIGHQATLQADADLVAQLGDMRIVTERYRPFGQSDFPALDIFLANDDFDNKDRQGVRGTVLYFLDLYTDGLNGEQQTEDGDTISAKRAQRIAGIIRQILEHPSNVRLQFLPSQGQPIIQTHLVQSIKRTEEEYTQDSLNVMMYRIIFKVVMSETVNQIQGTPIALHTTDVRIEDTDLGYQWIYDAQ